MKKEIPKYVERLLDRREDLAWQLHDVGVKLDRYCAKIGLDENWMDDAVLCSDFRIFTEPSLARRITERYIRIALDGKLSEEEWEDG